jgi:hypothetical protein
MAMRVSLSVRIALVVSVMVAILLGLMTLIIGLRLSIAVADLVRDENLQIAAAQGGRAGPAPGQAAFAA